MLKLHTTALISHASKVMLKIFQARFQQYLKTSRCSSWIYKRQRKQRSNCQHPLDHQKKWDSSRKTSTSALLTMPKSLTVWITHNQLENSERHGNIRPPDLTPEKSVFSKEATVRTGHRTTDWFQIGKRECQSWILSLCLINLYAENTMGNAGMDEAQAGIKIAGRNISNLSYTDDKTLLAKSEELKPSW